MYDVFSCLGQVKEFAAEKLMQHTVGNRNSPRAEGAHFQACPLKYNEILLKLWRFLENICLFCHFSCAMLEATYSLEVPDGFPGLRPILWSGAGPDLRVG